MTRQPTWRLLNSGAHDGYTNMATDEAMLLALQQGLIPPTLRLYAWEPPCLSIGCFQSVAEDVDTDACAARGIDWVRRPTGGRAILHDQEVTYSIVVRQDDERVAGDVMESYRRISLGLVEALRILGVQADMAAPHSPQAQSKAKPAACFAAPSQHEITVGGRKIIGSAQRRQGNVILQHGSLLLGLDVEKLTSVLRYPSPEARTRAAAQVRSEAVTLEELLGRRVSPKSVAGALAAGFASALDVDLVPASLTPAEEAERDRLLREKYRADQWRFRR